MEKKTQKDNQTHLSLNDRKIIQTGIENGSTKIAIANTIGKDASTVAKEIRKHRELKTRNTYSYPCICIHLKECKKCFKKCERYKEKTCKLRDRTPGACNKCSKSQKCHLDKYFYNANKAHNEHLYELKDARDGINLTTAERNTIGDIIAPLINQGQSIYQIKANHKEIKPCERTLYNYIDQGVFRDGYNLINLSLKEKVKRKEFKKYKKRKEPINYEGRKYSDYLLYKKDNPNIPTTQMDTLYNNPSGPYIQTFIFEKSPLMFGFLHHDKTSESMGCSLDRIENNLGHEVYCKLFSLLLTDRGTEFEKWQYFEANTITGDVRSKIFYCDAMASYQKANVENNHNYVRDLIPNEIDISNITQEDLELIFSHINSTPRESLEGKTPFEVFKFLYGQEIFELVLNKLKMKEIKKDEVILKPYLWMKK